MFMPSQASTGDSSNSQRYYSFVNGLLAKSTVSIWHLGHEHLIFWLTFQAAVIRLGQNDRGVLLYPYAPPPGQASPQKNRLMGLICSVSSTSGCQADK